MWMVSSKWRLCYTVDMTELAKKIQQKLDEGLSFRAIGRKAGMSNSTVRRAHASLELDRSSLEKFAAYFHVPPEEIYRWVGHIPAMYDSEGNFNDNWVMSELWKAIGMLTDDEQLELLAHIRRMERQRESHASIKQAIP